LKSAFMSTGPKRNNAGEISYFRVKLHSMISQDNSETIRHFCSFLKSTKQQKYLPKNFLHQTIEFCNQQQFFIRKITYYYIYSLRVWGAIFYGNKNSFCTPKNFLTAKLFYAYIFYKLFALK